jgi:glycosyltransferase involved in cell wall biosynthesis
VLYVDHVSVLSGGERSLLDLVRGIDPALFRPVLTCPGVDGPFPSAFRGLGHAVHGLEVDPLLMGVSRKDLDASFHRALGWAPATLAAARRVAAVARACGAHLISSNSLKAHVLASLAAWMTRLPLIWHMRDCLGPASGRMMGLLARFSTRRVVAISDAVCRSLRAAGTFPMDRVIRVYNGVEPPVLRHRTALRTELGIPAGALLVGTVGQISRWKGLHVLLEAIRAQPSIFAVITGECLFTGNEGPYRQELDDLAREPGLAGRVFFTGQREDIGDVMHGLDILVHPAVEPEPFGRVLVEAMAAGRPVIASDIGGVPEIVGPECGRLVAPEDAGALSRALAELASDPALRKRMGEAGRLRARALFSPDTCRRRMEEIYDEVLGGGR